MKFSFEHLSGSRAGRRGTRRAAGRAVALTAAWLAATALVSADTNGIPRLAAEPATIDFGAVDWHEPVERTFVLRNTGSATLNVPVVHAACGCAVVEIGAPEIAPGSNTTVRVRLDLRGRVGPQRIALQVQSNDPNQPVCTLTLTGVVRQDLEVQPPAVLLSRVALGTAVVSRVELSATSGPPVRVTGLVLEGAFVSAHLDTVQTGRQYTLTVRAGPFATAGLWRASATIRTDHPLYPQVAIPISYFVAGHVRVSPAEIVIPKSMLDAPGAARHITVRSVSEQSIRILGAEAPGTDIRVETLQGKGTECRLKAVNFAPPERLDGSCILLHVDIGGGRRETVRIPIRAASGP